MGPLVSPKMCPLTFSAATIAKARLCLLLAVLISAVATIIMVLVFLYVPVSDTGLLLLGVPLNIAILMKFAPMALYAGASVFR